MNARSLFLMAAAACAAPAIAAGAALRATPATGEALFQEHCAACHTIEEAERTLGPPLADLKGRKIGAYPGFSYSPALEKDGGTWDAARLDAFLLAPRTAFPGNRMPYAGMADPADRRALIAYLGL